MATPPTGVFFCLLDGVLPIEGEGFGPGGGLALLPVKVGKLEEADDGFAGVGFCEN